MLDLKPGGGGAVMMKLSCKSKLTRKEISGVFSVLSLNFLSDRDITS